VTEERVLPRFLLTAGEALTASVMLTVAGIALGVLLHRHRIVRLATETWVAALASAPLVLMYPLFLVIFGRSVWTIIMIAFVSALPTIFVGVRLGMIYALINIVGVEFLINLGGLGQLVNELAERYDLPGTYAAIGFVVLVSVLFFVSTERIERWLRPGT
jgi:ABC-type nitrate/sulfonate/bicarbonate transport system permease component